MSAEYNAKFANTDIATRAIHAGQEPDPTTGAVVTPIFATSTFKQDGVLGLRGGHDYSRSINPTRTSFDEQLAAVEGGKYALSFSSGLAAIDVLLRSTIKQTFNKVTVDSDTSTNDTCIMLASGAAAAVWGKRSERRRHRRRSKRCGSRHRPAASRRGKAHHRCSGSGNQRRVRC